MRLLIATANPGKAREVHRMLQEALQDRFELFSLREFPEYVPPPETGETFEENATLKAVDAAAKLDCLALADDSGLSVEALSGRPGVYSARYAGLDATDEANRKKLLREMAAFPPEERRAEFVCSLALARPTGLIGIRNGTCQGEILQEEQGDGGFGYDPLFRPDGYIESFAQLTAEEKNRISHRRNAVQLMIPLLESLLD